MKVHCRTNLDLDGLDIWPEELECLPPVGSKIVSGRKYNNDYLLELMVVGIRLRSSPVSSAIRQREWYYEIELNVPNQFKHVSHFLAWYDLIRGKITQEAYDLRRAAQERKDLH